MPGVSFLCHCHAEEENKWGRKNSKPGDTIFKAGAFRHQAGSLNSQSRNPPFLNWNFPPSGRKFRSVFSPRFSDKSLPKNERSSRKNEGCFHFYKGSLCKNASSHRKNASGFMKNGICSQKNAGSFQEKGRLSSEKM